MNVTVSTCHGTSPKFPESQSDVLNLVFLYVQMSQNLSRTQKTLRQRMVDKK